MSITDKFNYLKQTKENLKEVINLVKDEDEDKLTEESTFRSYPEALRKNYIKALNEGSDFIYDSLDKVTEEGETVVLDNTAVAPMKVSLNGNITQEKINAEAGTEIVNTEISVSDVNNEKENYITLQGNTYQETIEAQAGSEVEDTELAVNDVDSSKENYIILNGNTSQDTTSGKNKFSTDYLDSYTYDTYTQLSKNSFEFNATTSWKTSRFKIPCKSNTDYYFNLKQDLSVSTRNVYIVIRGIQTGEIIYELYVGYLKAFNSGENTELMINIQSGGAALSGKIYNIQLEEGTSPTEFEEYTGGQPSPSPDYPQQVKVVKGENVVSVQGKNLLKIVRGVTHLGITSVVNEDGSISFSGTATSSYCRISTEVEVDIPAGTYTFSRDKRVDYGTRMQVTFEDDTTSSMFTIGSRNIGATFTTTKKIKKILLYLISLTAGTEYNDTLYLQFEEGSTATPYVPYSKTDYTINLGTLELCKIGDYKDYLFKRNGKWYVHKEIWKKIFDGSENWADRQIESNTYLFLRCTLQNGVNGGISDKFKYNQSYNAQEEHILVSNEWKEASIVIRKDRLSTPNVANFKSWLSNNNVTLYYVLATPTEEEITDTSLIAQLDNLHTATLEETSYINSTPAKEYPYINLKYNVVTPAPSPDRASEINKVTGNNVVSVQGKNLFDKNITLHSGWYNDNGVFQSSTGTSHTEEKYKVKPNETYTLSGNAIAYDTTYVFSRIYYYDKDKNWLSRSAISQPTYSFVIPSNCYYIDFQVSIASGYADDYDSVKDNIQLELGSTASEYTPFSKTDYPISLGTLELCKIGDYQDYLYKNNGKWYVHKVIGKKVVTSSETLAQTDSYSKVRYFKFNKDTDDIDYNKYNNADIFYTSAKNVKNVYNYDDEYMIGKISPQAENVRYWVGFPKGTTLAQAKEKLVGSILYYVLATSTEEEITSLTLIEQLDNLYTAQLNNGINYITTETGNLLPYIDLKYNVVTQMPSPERPSEVKVVKGENVVSVSGKNLLPISSNVTQYGITSVKNEDGSISFSGIATSTYCYITNRTLVELPIGTYAFSINKAVNYGVRLQLEFEDGTTSNVLTIATGRTSVGGTTAKIVKAIRIYLISLTSGTEYNDTLYLQLEQGSTATPYVPYSKTDYPISLGTIELCKIGNYQDYLHKDSGKWYVHKEIKKIVLDGTRNWIYQDEATTPTPRTVIRLQNVGLGSDLYFSSHFIKDSSSSNRIVFLTAGGGTIYLSLDNTLSGIDTTDDSSIKVTKIKTWLSNNNVTLYYVLATPTEEEITNSTLIEQLEAIAKAKSVKDKTYITQTNEEIPFIIDATAIKKYEEVQ